MDAEAALTAQKEMADKAAKAAEGRGAYHLYAEDRRGPPEGSPREAGAGGQGGGSGGDGGTGGGRGCMAV